MALVTRTREELRLALPPDRTKAVVMTMGALHDGHADLIDAARARVGPAGHVLVTVFVNPAQFGAGEDLARYPRTEQADIELCRRHGADVVFMPGVSAMYGAAGPVPADRPPTGVTIDPGPLGAKWEGAARPGHFRGVLTVVNKLLHLSAADVAAFGEKDYQQLVLIRAMVQALDMRVEILPVPTRREPDGLALSSRNRYLDQAERAAAGSFARALRSGEQAARRGAAADVVEQTVLAELARVPLVEVDYVDVADLDLGPAPMDGPARLLAAVRVGRTRLIDNRPVDVQGVA